MNTSITKMTELFEACESWFSGKSYRFSRTSYQFDASQVAIKVSADLFLFKHSRFSTRSQKLFCIHFFAERRPDTVTQLLFRKGLFAKDFNNMIFARTI